MEQTTAEHLAENSSQPLLNVVISFAILDTFFLIAFIFSWSFNQSTTKHKTVFSLVLVGYIFCMAGVVLGILKITIGGAGYHAKTLHLSTIRLMLKLIKAHEIIYVMAIPFPKLAILCLYFRLFTSKISHVILYLTGFVIVATCLFGVVAFFANCRPFASFWDRKIPGHCTMDVMTVYRYYSVPNIFTDVVMLLMPIPALWNQQISWLTKIGVFITFLTSTFGIVTAVLRFVSFFEVDLFSDITYLCVTTTSWTIIEPGVYLIAATMPTLRPLIRRIFKELDDFCPVTRCITHWLRQPSESTASDTVEGDLKHRLRKRSSNVERINTIGKKPSRTFRLDEFHFMQDLAAVSLRSIDEESMVCAAAVSTEKLAREGRNADGSLLHWSLQPIQMSPLRASFHLL
ncbi:hypothetical protein K469DRAFT_583387 [Zopfia rhizophila CBS 207.26]|uniref:Rhodopsin domain-containing protein n=1 Tax=Zopfia rhizophila CBS 207.26 TaxID=1314779 RepID=A0A6A6E0I2_9PEZI|nr:hypothetical protein K469DRAFT_583387 [Zopfia rhizophila CBS 207.26]